MSRISGLRNDMNKRTFYKERQINNRSFDYLSKPNIKDVLHINIQSLMRELLSSNLSFTISHFWPNSFHSEPEFIKWKKRFRPYWDSLVVNTEWIHLKSKIKKLLSSNISFTTFFPWPNTFHSELGVKKPWS